MRVAVVGATGIIGHHTLAILAERRFPLSSLKLFASERSTGSKVEFNGELYCVNPLSAFDASLNDIVFFSAGSEIAKHYAPIAVKQGALVIDNSSCFRYEDNVPLIVPEVNAHTLGEHTLIANPNCSTAGLVVALKPLCDAFGLKHINVTTFQSVSGSGKRAMQELLDQTENIAQGIEITPPQVFPQQIAFNVLPHIDHFQENGYTREEMKIIWESRKILGLPDLAINVTAIRVPVLVGHSMSLTIQFERCFQLTSLLEVLERAPGLVVMSCDKDNGYPTPVHPVAGQDNVHIGRIRRDLSQENAINCWLVVDNLRKGGALNAVQIAEHFLSQVQSRYQPISG